MKETLLSTKHNFIALLKHICWWKELYCHVYHLMKRFRGFLRWNYGKLSSIENDSKCRKMPVPLTFDASCRRMPIMPFADVSACRQIPIMLFADVSGCRLMPIMPFADVSGCRLMPILPFADLSDCRRQLMSPRRRQYLANAADTSWPGRLPTLLTFNAVD